MNARLLAAVLIAGIGLAGSPAQAQQAGCAQMPVDALVEGGRAADYIFQGRVQDQIADYGVFTVDSYWLGSSGPELAVKLPEEGGWTRRLAQGQSYVILAKRYGGVLWLDPCLQAAAAAKPDALMQRLGR